MKNADTALGGGVPRTTACVITKDGVCEEHGPAMKKWKPKRSWAKGKNGLFAWRYSRTHYYVCTGQTTRVGHPTHRPTFLVLKEDVMMKTDDTSRKTFVGNNDQTK